MYLEHVCLLLTKLLDLDKLKCALIEQTELNVTIVEDTFYTYKIFRDDQIINETPKQLISVSVNDTIIFQYDIEGNYNYEAGEALLYLYLRFV